MDLADNERLAFDCAQAYVSSASNSIELLVSNGVRTFIEVGAGKVLSGLVKQINRDVRSLNVEDSESLRNSLMSL